MRRVALAIASLAVTAAVLEGALRLFGPFFPGSYQTAALIEPDDPLGWRNIAGAEAWVRRGDTVVQVTIGDDGSFGPSAAPNARCRVVLLGDSYLAPVQVPFEQSAVAMLRRGLGPATSVIDRAVQGYGTDQEVLLLERSGPAMRADVVVVLFAVANDVWNNDWTLESRAPTRVKPYFDLDPSGELRLHAAPAVGLDERVRGMLGRSALVTVLRTAVFDRLAAAGVRGQQLAVLDTPSGTWDEAWRITDALIARLGRWSRENATPVVFAIGPDPCQVSADRCADHAPPSSALPQIRVTEAARRAGLPVVDLLPAFRARSDGGLFAPGDIHWSAAGNAIAASELERGIRSALPARCA